MRIAGFGPDALATVLDDQRRVDDIPCVVFDRIRFRAGTARPLPAALSEIDVIARVLAAGPVGEVRIGSRIGTSRMTPANRQLAAERARVVRSALVARGVAQARLSIDTSTTYHTLIGDDLGPIGVPLVPSVGLCVAGPTA
jgi:outer membrane protein OmpA-like peptidoglycan-associated protein